MNYTQGLLQTCHGLVLSAATLQSGAAHAHLPRQILAADTSATATPLKPGAQPRGAAISDTSTKNTAVSVDATGQW